MIHLPEDRILQYRPDTLLEVRKECGLDKPGSMNDAVDILEEWVQKQSHHVRKDYSRTYLERVIMVSKGSLEKSKRRIDKLCTVKTMMPEYFNITSVSAELKPLTKKINFAVLPKLTSNHNRVFMFKVLTDFNSEDLYGYYRTGIMIAEYLKHSEYCKRFKIIVDITEVSLLTLMSRVNPIFLAQYVNVLTEGYGMRLQEIIVISSSKTIETFMSFIKQALKQKVKDKITIVKSEQDVYQRVPKEIMPRDYGGQEKTLKELTDQLLNAFETPENMTRYIEMNKFTTDEAYRQTEKFNETYMGMPGSFRALSVD